MLNDVRDITEGIRRADTNATEWVPRDRVGYLGGGKSHDDIAGFAMPPTGRHLPEFTLGVIDDRAVRPRQQRGDEHASALAAASRAKAHGVRLAGVRQVTQAAPAVGPASHDDAGLSGRQQSAPLDVVLIREARCAMNCWMRPWLAPS